MTWIERFRSAAAHGGMRSHAARIADAARAVPRPPDRHSPVRVGADGDAYRILLFGSGPASGWGVRQQEHGLGSMLGAALHRATGFPVVVDFLVDDHWEESDPAAALRAQGLARYDAVVAVSAYRSTVLDVPIDTWRGFVDEMRDVMIAESGPDGRIEILSLPWEDAVHRAPGQWGGRVGERILLLQAEARDSLQGFRQLGSLMLAPPDDAAEWTGPSFSAATYRRWGAQIAAQVAPRLPAAPTRAAQRA